MFNKKKKSDFDYINDYLSKMGHDLILSIYLSNFNGNNIYIRLDYVEPLSVYKVVWVDFNFFNRKKIYQYINVQTLTKHMAMELMDALMKVNYDSYYGNDENILGDRVEILSYALSEPREYIFDRYLPLELEDLVNVLVIIFTYLPRGMEVFLLEIGAKFDGTVSKYNYLKPNRFKLLESPLSKLFSEKLINDGKKLYEDNCVLYLEKVFDGKYISIVKNGNKTNLVILREVNEEFSQLWCSCRHETFCSDIVAVLYALRYSKFVNFYKVKYIGKEKSLLDMVTDYDFHYCFGYEDDKLLLVGNDGKIIKSPIVVNGKVVFDIIEDDDDFSLSKIINEYKMK